MKISRFYQESNLENKQELELSQANHRHAIQVLRMKLGESLILFNGKGGEYLAKLISIDKRKSHVELKSFSPVNRESPLQSTLVLAMIKPEKMDFALQKAVELGITTIQPMYTNRSVIKIKASRLEKKMQHWNKVIIAACEQSGRTSIPILKEPQIIEPCLSEYANTLGITMLPGSNPKITELHDVNLDQGISLFVGPEGGFTDEEEKMMIDGGLVAVSFGRRILRAETAAIAGLTVCQQCWGDL